MTRPNSTAHRFQEDELAHLEVQGAAGGVTGSRYLLVTRASRVLVDCGMVQGGKHAEQRNRAPWPFSPRELSAVVLTHAHIDHSGLLPALVRDGYRGAIHLTEGSADLAAILLRDSAHIHESDARRRSRRRQRRGERPLEPLYTIEDTERCLPRFEVHPFGERVQLTEDVAVRFARAGHILGAASVELWIRDAAHERKLVFSGDLGRRDDPILRSPDPPQDAELVVIESTYGDRDHRDLHATLEELVAILNESERLGDHVLVPVFAVGRSQELLYYLRELEEQGRIRPRRVVLDSPMAIDVTELYRRHIRELGPELRERVQTHPRPLRPQQLELSRLPEQSMALNEQRGAIILAGSGMCTGGRILHHLKHHLWRDSVRVLIVGFQAEGTLGRALVDGAREVRVMGEPIAVRAQVHTLGGFSAHAGRNGLQAWYRGLGEPRPRPVVVHGEDRARAALAEALQAEHGVEPLVPALDQRISIPRSGARFELVPA